MANPVESRENFQICRRFGSYDTAQCCVLGSQFLEKQAGLVSGSSCEYRRSLIVEIFTALAQQSPSSLKPRVTQGISKHLQR
jgi:hypothetical protein